MSETLNPVATEVDEGQQFERLLAQVKDQAAPRLRSSGPVHQLTKKILGTEPDNRFREHRGVDINDPLQRGGANSGNSARVTTVRTEIQRTDVDPPQETTTWLASHIAKARQRQLARFESLVLSLAAKGLTPEEVVAYVADVHGVNVNRDAIFRVIEKSVVGMADWFNRSLETVYAVIFVETLAVKILDRSVGNRPIYVVFGLTCSGERDILGLWAGHGEEDVRYWRSVLTEIKNRGTSDVCILVGGELRGLPEAVQTVWDQAIIQTGVIPLLRNTFRYASGRHGDQMARDIRPVYTAPNEAAAKERLIEFTTKWGAKYPAITPLWERGWSEFAPFLKHHVEIRRVICCTHAVDSINARYQHAINARGHFTTEHAALKCLYLVTRSLDARGPSRARWVRRWKPALNAFAITFNGRISPTGN